MLERMWRHQNSRGASIHDTIILKTVWEFNILRKFNIYITTQKFHTKVFIQEKWKDMPTISLMNSVHRNFIHNNRKR